MAQYGNKGSKNPPWARADQSGMGMATNQMQQSLLNPNLAAALPNAAMLPYPQPQMFQGQIGYQQQFETNSLERIAGFIMITPSHPSSIKEQSIKNHLLSPSSSEAVAPKGQIYNNIGTVQYPTRALNSAAFQNAATPSVQNNQQRSNESNKERVITGNVTKLQDNFGFVDDDIFFQLSCVTNGANNLRIGSRVLVEATFNPTMPFKWNAQRIQVLPTNTNQNQQQRGNYSAVPPPCKTENNSGDRFSNNRYGNNRNQQQQNKNKQQQQQQVQARRPQVDRVRERSASVDSDRKRRKNERRGSTSRDRRTRSRSRSPTRKKRRAYVPRYNVTIPKFNLNNFENDVMDLKRKFNNMYVPSDFFLSRSSWQESFPVDKPFNLDVPCKFHVFSKEVSPLKKPAPEPSDADYLYSAKVILFASPGLEELYKKCITLAEDSSRSQSRSPDDDMTIPAKMISLLVGQRGKEPMAIGGPWSPSLDGDNPDSDPGVLIKTAIRTTKYQTGIDLSNCTHWFRFLEMHYRRSESVPKGKAVAARVETVVLFIPDIWSCVPTRPEWQDIDQAYSKMLLRQLTNNSNDDPEEKKEEEDEGNDSEIAEIIKKDPTHYSELDPKIMKVSDLRDELEARGLSPKGLKTQLIARLTKAIKTEADAEDQKEVDKEKMSDDELDYDDKPDEEEHEKEEDKSKEEKLEIDEKEKARLEKLYKLPESPTILVHPNPDFKAGKFNCTVASLYSLLNYRVEDNKEHSFELFLFAEMFNAMLMRDFSIHIYRAMWVAAEKINELKEKEEKEKKKEKSKEAKDKDEKKPDKDKKGEDEEKKDKEEEDDKDDKESVHSKDRRDDKKKEKVKLKTADPYLLLSFAYFDNTLCGYIVDRDLEDMLTNLCLSLSRAQIKKLVQRVVTKDALHYRKLTDKTKEEIEESPQDLLDFPTLFTHANRQLEPRAAGQSSKSQQAEKLESGFVTFNGSLIDVGKLMKQLERNEASRLNTEKLYNRLVEDNNSLKSNYDNSVKTVKDLTSELGSFKKRLNSTNNDLDVMSARVMRYVDAIFQVKKHIDPIIKENTPEEEPKIVPKAEIKSEPGELTLKRRESKKELEKKEADSKQKDSSKKETEKKEEKDDKSQDSENNDDVEEIKGSDEEKEKAEEQDMDVEETLVISNGENESDKTEDDDDHEKGKPEPKRKPALRGGTPAKRTPMKRDVKKDSAVATPSTPSKRKRI